jgi:hypothetical protein
VHRLAPAPAAPGAATGRAGAGGGGRAGGRGREGQPANLPLSPPVGGLKPDDWNHLEILLDANIVRPFLNDSPIATGAADDAVGRYGPVALYIGGAGEVRYKDLATSDPSQTLPLERISPNLNAACERVYCQAPRPRTSTDGVNDIAAGPYYYLGPDFTKSREIYLAQTVNPSVAYPNDCMQNFAADFTATAGRT